MSRCHCGHIEDDHQEDYGCYECERLRRPSFAHEFDEDVEGYEEHYDEGGEGLDEKHMREAGRIR